MIPTVDCDSMSQAPSQYIGRFAPSPTGPLHAGSLVAALASYLDARAHNGQWLVRIDDIDPPRAVPDADHLILECLRAHGLHADQTVSYQSTHSDAYDTALSALAAADLLFHCRCTRANLGPLGTCVRDCGVAPASKPSADTSLRVKVDPDVIITFDDLIRGPQRFTLGQQISNFIVRRRDGLYAYQLAAAVDDAAPSVSHVIRGSDLLDSTPRQIYLQQHLQLGSPQYGHLPVVTDADGNKLSKQSGATALNNDVAVANLRAALAVLGQPAPPESLIGPEAVLGWSIANWCRECVPE